MSHKSAAPGGANSAQPAAAGVAAYFYIFDGLAWFSRNAAAKRRWLKSQGYSVSYRQMLSIRRDYVSHYLPLLGPGEPPSGFSWPADVVEPDGPQPLTQLPLELGEGEDLHPSVATEDAHDDLVAEPSTARDVAQAASRDGVKDVAGKPLGGAGGEDGCGIVARKLGVRPHAGSDEVARDGTSTPDGHDANVAPRASKTSLSHPVRTITTSSKSDEGSQLLPGDPGAEDRPSSACKESVMEATYTLGRTPAWVNAPGPDTPRSDVAAWLHELIHDAGEILADTDRPWRGAVQTPTARSGHEGDEVTP